MLQCTLLVLMKKVELFLAQDVQSGRAAKLRGVGVHDSGQKLAVVCAVQVAFLNAHRSEKVIVYFLTCACVEFYALVLKRVAVLKGLEVSSLHGKLKQVGSSSYVLITTWAA